MKKIIFFLLSLNLCTQAYAQDKKTLDSLMRVYNTAQHDTTKIMALTSIAFEYKSNKPDTCIALAEKALQMSEQIDFKKGIGRAWNSIGLGNMYKGNYPKALELYQKALSIFEKIQDKEDIANSLFNLGSFHYYQENIFLAVEYFKKSLNKYEEINQYMGVIKSNLNIGMSYVKERNYNLALKFYEKSLEVSEKNKKNEYTNFITHLIGNVYIYIGNREKGFEYIENAITKNKKISNNEDVSLGLRTLGNILYNEKKFLLSMKYYKESLKFANKSKDTRTKVYLLDVISENYQVLQKYDSTIYYAKEGLELSNKLALVPESIMFYLTLYNTYKLKGDYVKALEYHELYKQTNDSLFNADKAKKIANIEAKAEIERKEKEIEILNKNQEIAKKNEEAFKKDAELQRIEAERQKNAKLALEKEAEAKALLYQATQEKDKRKADSLRSLAQAKQLEVEKHLAQEQKLKAESTARKLEVLKEKEAKEFQQYINYLVLLGLLSVLIFAYFIFRSRQKEKKAKELASQQKEEIQQINEELNTTLKVVEEERSKSDKLLLNILPQEVATELKETGKTEVKYFESVTVLFADVKGFSALATKISPQELITELDATFTKMDEISLRFGLKRIKTIGDCYMACGGLPEANKTHPFDAVLSALHIQKWMDEERKKRNGNFWQVRLGLHTGDAVAGVIGKTKFAYDIWGNTVNLASRMESGGEVGKVNVTEQTFEMVKDYFEGFYREEIEAKNIGKVKAYFITRLKPEYSQDEAGFEPNERFGEVYKSL